MLRDHIPLWLDDCLYHNETIDYLIEDLCCFFTFYRDYYYPLKPRKCKLFCLHSCWCGCLISPDGKCHDPCSIAVPLEMYCPTAGGQLQQFLCAMQ